MFSLWSIEFSPFVRLFHSKVGRYTSGSCVDSQSRLDYEYRSTLRDGILNAKCISGWPVKSIVRYVPGQQY